MKKLLGFLTLVLGTAVVLSPSAWAASYGSAQLDSSNCKINKKTTTIANVNFRIINDYDSGIAGNAWANDTIHRELRIFQTSPHHFCATVTDTGKFTTFAGPSPQNTGHLAKDIQGTMTGGYIVNDIAGDVVADPAYPTRGDIGRDGFQDNTFDLHCTDAYTCTGNKPGISDYITGWNGETLNWWGWQYVTSHNGTWINSIDGNSGDITGSKANGEIQMLNPHQKIKFNTATNNVEYWNYDYTAEGSSGLHYTSTITCDSVNAATKESRFMFQIPAGHPGLSGLYIVAFVKINDVATKDYSYGHAATSDLATATQWCQTLF
jgi:hypothetical protein